jgi:hypothetical protein
MARKYNNITFLKHLGIYKSLVNARKYNILTDKERLNNVSFTGTVLPVALQCIQIQYFLMKLAVIHCHTFNRWKIVHNFLLEKIPGYPLLEKLRVIHIYEADYIAYKLNTIAAKEKTTPAEQAGDLRIHPLTTMPKPATTAL